MKNLTPCQEKIFDFIVKTWRSNFHAPTMEEIADEFGFSTPTGARDHLRALEKKGMIRRETGKARSIRITDPATLTRLGFSDDVDGGQRAGVGIPVLGRIAAGLPVEAIEHCDRILPLPGSVFGRGDIFALEVQGESMIDAGICDGDLAIVARQDAVESGEIAAVVIDGEATLKTVIHENQTLILRAANPLFADMVFRAVEAGTIRIAGKYVGLIRSESWKEGLAA